MTHKETKQFSKNIYEKLEIIHKLKAYGFIKNNQDTQTLLRSALNEAKNGFIAKRGFLRLETRLKALISEGLSTSKCNIFLTNFPRVANTIDGTYEEVNIDNIYDTLINHSLTTSRPLFVLPLNNSTYIALMPSAEDAKHIVGKLNGMICNNQKLQLDYIQDSCDILIDRSLNIQAITYSEKLLWLYIALINLAVIFYTKYLCG